MEMPAPIVRPPLVIAAHGAPSDRTKLVIFIHGDGSRGGPSDYLFKTAATYGGPGVVAIGKRTVRATVIVAGVSVPVTAIAPGRAAWQSHLALAPQVLVARPSREPYRKLAWCRSATRRSSRPSLPGAPRMASGSEHWS